MNLRNASLAADLPGDLRLMQAATRALALVLAALVLMAAALWVLRHPAFALRGITVQGDTAHTNEVTLRAIVAPRLAGNFFTLDLGAARSAFEAVPWVRRAVVRREFPNRLRVTLEEHQAAALWGADGESRLINTHGELFEANPGDVNADELPRLGGPDSQAARVLQTFRTLAPLLEAQDAGLAELELTHRGSWRAVLDNGATLELGRGDAVELRARLERFTATITQVAARYGRRGLEQLESADLRHPNGYALRLRGVTTVGPATPEAARH